MVAREPGGFRLFSFRQGDRSEYLALYALSRVAFVTPVPRQEDVGVVDFRCVLARHEGRRDIPKGTFNVQVKSRGSTLGLNEGEIRWLSTNMDSPLFMCVVDKKNMTIALYSCQHVWSALFYRMHPRAIRLLPKKTGPNGVRYVHYPLDIGDPVVDMDGEFDVFLGQPVIEMSVDDFETRADDVCGILDAWIKLDRFNVALMRLGRPAAWAYTSWNPNGQPGSPNPVVFYRADVNQHGLLNKVLPVLWSLSLSYARAADGHDRAAEIDKLAELLEADIDGDPRDVDHLFG
jgi:hypothetical protein